MMNCEQYQEFISQFIDGELDSVNELSLFQHLSTCDECRGFLKETMSLRSELLSKTSLHPNVELDARMRQTIFADQRMPYGFRAAGEKSIISRFIPIAISVVTIVLLAGVLILPSILLQRVNDMESSRTSQVELMMKAPGYNSTNSYQGK
jgi:predicted anti-sigma-YlaC factor YlaD